MIVLNKFQKKNVALVIRKFVPSSLTPLHKVTQKNPIQNRKDEFVVVFSSNVSFGGSPFVSFRFFVTSDARIQNLPALSAKQLRCP